MVHPTGDNPHTHCPTGPTNQTAAVGYSVASPRGNILSHGNKVRGGVPGAVVWSQIRH